MKDLARASCLIRSTRAAKARPMNNAPAGASTSQIALLRSASCRLDRRSLAVVEKRPLAFGDFGKALDDRPDRREDQDRGKPPRSPGRTKTKGRRAVVARAGRCSTSELATMNRAQMPTDPEGDATRAWTSLPANGPKPGGGLGSEKAQTQARCRTTTPAAMTRSRTTAGAALLCPRFQCLRNGTSDRLDSRTGGTPPGKRGPRRCHRGPYYS